MEKVPINVSKKILADVSSGIYRTPANALKEIVSNAFDAGAHRVHISTNAPYFDVFTCEDDGDGISASEFKETMQRIGSSGKRRGGDKNPDTGRPIIGKIGIGMLSVAQICNRFSFISKRKGQKHYFHATVDLRQFDEVEQDTEYRDGRGDISLGTYDIETELPDELGPTAHYTKIVMEDLKQGFQSKLLEEEAKDAFRIREAAISSRDFREFIRSVRGKKFNEISQYDQLVWELGLLCPVEYVDRGPLPNNNPLKKEIHRLRSYDFKVFVDGYEIRKPVEFPTDEKMVSEDDDYKVYPPFQFNKVVDDRKLVFSGYLFHQRTRIKPAELQGILIRIKDVAVGSYDRTFLHYPEAVGPMLNQLSGEIFVKEGLEEALNIDRNSFNETHSHYLALQQYLWEYLGGEEGVFKDIRQRSKDRQRCLREQERDQQVRRMLEAVRSVLGKEFALERNDKGNQVPYECDARRKVIRFYSNPFWAKHQRHRVVQEKMVVAIMAARSVSKDIKAFEGNLLKILGHGKF